MSANDRDAGQPQLGRWVAWSLRTGTLIAMGLVAAGYAWAVADGEESVPRPLIDVIAAGGGDAISALGLLTLVLLPIAALAVAATAFVQARERRMAATTVLVGLLLIASLLVAAVAGAAS